GTVLAADNRQASMDLTDHGVAVPLAERRGVVATQDRNGRSLVLACSLDTSPRGWILVTDIDSKRTTQVHFPQGVANAPPYGSILASSGLFYTGAGNVLLEFDPTKLEWTHEDRPLPNASCYLSFTEAPDGSIWGGTYPATTLVSYEPKTRQFKSHGLLDDKEKYLSSLGVDDAGWVYGGIGTQLGNIVAYNPRTNEKRQLVPQKLRKVGTAVVHRSGDGRVYGRANLTDGKHFYRFHNGEAEEIQADDMGRKAPSGAIYWGARKGLFPDGRRLTDYNMVDMWLMVKNPDTGNPERIEFDYQSEGSVIRVLTTGADGKVYGNSAHPSRNFVCDPADNIPRYRPGAIAMKGFASQGKFLIGGHYGGGKLYVYDTTKPWRMEAGPARLGGGIPARELAKRAEHEDGQVHYFEEHDIVFFRDETYGTEVRFPIETTEAGEHHLAIHPYQSPGYCTVQFTLDGQKIGKPYCGNNKKTGLGTIQIHGPIQLKIGRHMLGVRTIEAGAGNPWIGLRSVALTRTKPGDIVARDQPQHPILACSFAPDINVPWGACAHPNGRHVMISGPPGYGYVGGGIGIYDLQTKQSQLLTHEQLFPGQSVQAMVPLDNGDLVCGTTIAGGHGTRASSTTAFLFILDWTTRKVRARIPAPNKAKEIGLLTKGADGLVYGTADRALFVFDPEKRKIVHTADLGEYGSRAVNGMATSAEGTVYVVFSKAILRIKPDTFEVERIVATPGNANAGIALAAGRVYFAVGSHLWSVKIL
ncbi:MAG: hypothetical protein KAI66_25740, partial [Lentisphaeria bacterium]|nr:hypothetical protein [Lentisphaeria bacterium]